MKMKVCSGCSVEKPIDCFNRDRAKVDGFQMRCRTCWQATYVKQGKKKTPAISAAEDVEVEQNR